MKRLATALAVLLVAGSVAPLAAAGQGADGQAYDGTHVSFETENSAMTNYRVDGKPLVSAVKVQSTESAESSGIIDVGADLKAITNLDGSALSLGAETETAATVKTEGSAKVEAHDNANGILVVSAGGNSQYVQASVSSDTEANAEGDKRVSITTGDGAEGTFIVVGDGQVTVNEEGNVSAELGQDGRLVFRSYPEGKSDDDEKQEHLIADGKAAAEVHVMEKDGRTVADTVNYSRDTTVAAEQSAENAVNVTVDRASHEGTVVIATVSKSAIESAESLRVTVDGEAAARATSYGELEGAIGSDQSKYMVRQGGSARASADVLVGVNHFSERNIRMSAAGSGSDDDDDGDSGNDSDGDDSGNDGVAPSDGQPGFGIVVAIVALGAALIAARLR